jgi:hypothetical protein
MTVRNRLGSDVSAVPARVVSGDGRILVTGDAIAAQASATAASTKASEAAASALAAAASAAVVAGDTASQAEAEAGAVNNKGMSPLRTAQALAAQRPFASQAEAEAATDNSKVMTSLRTAQALAAQRPLASQAEAQAGTDNSRVMTPLRVKQAIKVLHDPPPSIKGLGFDVRGDGSPSDADMTRETAAINSALQASRAVTFPNGNYLINGPLTTQHDTHIIAPGGFEEAGITRGGSQNWAGHTLRMGPDLAFSFHVEGLRFQNPHPGFNSTVSGSTIGSTRLTSGQAHIFARSGGVGVIRDCWFDNGVYNIALEGGTSHRIEHCYFTGFWDDLNAGRQETVANIHISNDLVNGGGYATMHQIVDCYVAAGGFSEDRTYTVGTTTFVSHHDLGPAYGILVQGCEGLKVVGGYIGGNNRASIRLEAGSGGAALLSDIDINGVFFDSQMESAIVVDTTNAGNTVSSLAIRGNTFNGQVQGPRALIVRNTNGVSCDDLIVSDNIIKNHTFCPLYLSGARQALIEGNIVTRYAARGGGVGNAGIAAGAVIDGASSDVHFGPNYWAGGTSQWGPYFFISSGSAIRQRGTMSVGGGSLVAGYTEVTAAGTY